MLVGHRCSKVQSELVIGKMCGSKHDLRKASRTEISAGQEVNLRGGGEGGARGREGETETDIREIKLNTSHASASQDRLDSWSSASSVWRPSLAT